MLAELKHSNNGDVLKTALTDKRIFLTSEEELKQALKYIMLLVGLRTASINAMDEMEKIMLISFIRRNYSAHTVSELKLAFDLAISGKLEIKEVNCFENFTCEYFGKIMNAYRKWAQNHFDEKQLFKPEVKLINYTPTAEEIENGNRELIQLRYERYLNGDTGISFLPEFGVQQLATDGFTDAEVWQDFTKQALRYQKTEIFNARELLILGGKSEHAKEAEQRIADLKETDEIIISIAKKLALVFCFEQFKKAGAEHIYKQV